MMNLTAEQPGLKPQLTVRDMAQSAAWQPWQIRVDGMAQFAPMSLESYAASSFLDNRIVSDHASAPVSLNIGAFRGAFPDVAGNSNSFIFHISHVGSTLLSKVFGTKLGVLSLREPVILRWLAEIRREIRRPESRYTPAGYEELLRVALGMLARPLDGSHTIVVKASSFASILAEDILTLQPKSSAIGLFCKFNSFASTVLKGGGGWSDMLQQAPTRLRRLHAISGRPQWALATMSVGEIVAVNWLAEMVVLARAAQSNQGRFHLVDFDQFIASPLDNVDKLADFLQIGWTAQDSRHLSESGVLNKYSKSSDMAYSVENRERDNNLAALKNAPEINKGLEWIRRALNENEILRVANPFLI